MSKPVERLLGRKTMETEILREALEQARQKTRVALAVAASGRFPLEAVADTLGVARSNLVDRLRHPERRRRGPHRRTGDDELLAEIRAITDARPTYGHRRVAALLNHARRGSGEPPVNLKRVLRLMQHAALTLQPHTARRPIRAHEGSLRVYGDLAGAFQRSPSNFLAAP